MCYRRFLVAAFFVAAPDVTAQVDHPVLPDKALKSSLSVPGFWKKVSLADAVDLGFAPVLRPTAEQFPAGDLVLTSVGGKAGLNDVVGGGNAHGVGVAFTDLDGDDYADIFIVNGFDSSAQSMPNGAHYASRFLRNDRQGGFVEVSQSSGIASILADRDLYSIAAADYDQDGDVDLYIGAQPKDILLRNSGGGVFEDATDAAAAGGPASDPARVRDGRGKIVSFGDYNRDGRIDLVSSSGTFVGKKAYLLANQGDGSFKDVTDVTNLATHPQGNACAVLWSDYDNDGDQDLWIWNDRGGHVLLNNIDASSFVDVSQQAENASIANPMGIDSADINHDGFLDYYITNITGNPLLLNQGDGTFSNITVSAGTGGEFGWGTGFEDFNADTWPDLFVAQEDNLPYLVFTHEGTDPPKFARTEWLHNGVDPSAHNVAVAFADYDHDGRVDVVTATTDGSRINLFRNETDLGTQAWLHVVIKQEPGGSAFGGVAARVAVKTGDLVQINDIKGGSSRASQNELSARFGLGQWTGAQWVAILWPDGRQRVFLNVPGNQRLVVDNTTPLRPSIEPLRGLWFNPARDGHGIEFNALGDQAFALWYTYTHLGDPIWYLSDTVAYDGGLWQAGLSAFHWDGDKATPSHVGQIEIDFVTLSTAKFSWALGNQTGSEEFIALRGAGGCIDGSDQSGTWFVPDEPGYGSSVLRDPGVEAQILYLYDTSGDPSWVIGSTPTPSDAEIEMTAMLDGFCPACTFHPATATPAGRLSRNFSAQSAATLDMNLVLAAPNFSLNWHKQGMAAMLSSARPCP